jgi:hypothetical protein
MRMLPAWAAGFLGIALIATTNAPGRAGGVMTADDRQYLTFQIFTAGPGMTTEDARHVLSRLPEPTLFDDEAKRILDAVGERGDALHRLGIVVGPLALDYTDAQLRTLIERTFEVASKYKIAVGLHIDDSKFWMNRSDLWRNPANVEWLDWNGSPNSGQYLNWGEPWKLAPQACFNSQAVVKEARRITRDVIGPAITAGMENLRRSGDEALFAGVIVGWETAIGRDFDTGRDLGYCALTNLGYSANSPPPDFDRALESVVQSWIETWSSGLADAGVPRDKIYSHIAFTPKKRFDEAHRAESGSYSRSVLYTPPWVAFGESHRAGFSTYPNADRFNELYAALKAHGGSAWASAEGTNVDIETGLPRIPDETMEDYLARMFNHGATLINVFGWDIGDSDNIFRRAAEGAESISAYRKFLSGAHLEEKPLDQSYHSDVSVLQGLIRALPARIQNYVRAGGSESVIRPKVAELEQNMKDGRLDALKRNLNQIEADIDAQVAIAAKGGFDVAVLQQKVRALPQKIAAYQQSNGDMNRIKARVESIQRRLDAGELEKAFEEVQALEPILDSP